MTTNTLGYRSHLAAVEAPAKIGFALYTATQIIEERSPSKSMSTVTNGTIKFTYKEGGNARDVGRVNQLIAWIPYGGQNPMDAFFENRKSTKWSEKLQRNEPLLEEAYIGISSRFRELFGDFIAGLGGKRAEKGATIVHTRKSATGGVEKYNTCLTDEIKDTKQSQHLDVGYIAKELDPITDRDWKQMLYPTEDITKRNSIHVQTLPNMVKFSWDDDWFNIQLSILQGDITHMLEGALRDVMVRPVPVGLAIVRPNRSGIAKDSPDGHTPWKIHRRPSNLLRVTERTVIRAMPMIRNSQRKEEQRLAVLVYFTARSLQDWAEFDGKPMIEGMGTEDYMALIYCILYGASGSGKTEIMRTYSADDINTTIKALMGTGFTKATLFPAGSIPKGGSPVDFANCMMKLHKFHILLGFCIARSKATIEEWKLDKAFGHRYDISHITDAVTSMDIQGAGNMDAFHMFMPRNFAVDGEEDEAEIMFPCVIRLIESVHDEKIAKKHANVYRAKVPRSDITTLGTPLPIINGYADKPMVKPGQETKLVVRPVAQNDARQCTYEYNGREIRAIEYPLEGMLMKEDIREREFGVSEKEARLMHLIGVLSMGDGLQKNAMIIHPSFAGLMSGIRVTRNYTMLGELVTKVEGSKRNKIKTTMTKDGPVEVDRNPQTTTSALPSARFSGDSHIDYDGDVKPGVADEMPLDHIQAVTMGDSMLEQKSDADEDQHLESPDDPTRINPSEVGKDAARASGRRRKGIGKLTQADEYADADKTERKGKEK